MEITIQNPIESKSLPKNQYKIVMNTYFGDADGYKKYKFIVDAKKIEQVILEILFVEYQFENGRGGCRNMYDQNCYFNNSSHSRKEFFTWFDNYPYDSNAEQNYSLDEYTVTFFDKNSVEHKVSISKTDNIIEDIRKMNEKFKIDDYKEWDNLGSDDKKFAHYYEAVISYIEKYQLENIIEKKEKNNKGKLKV
jgi:hypothetical protein